MTATAVRVGGAQASTDGKIAGLYDLEETIGKGHYAIVKRARHVFTGERVAVKVIDKTKLDEVSRAHLFQEVRCMKLVQHPHVVRLYEVIDTATRLYLVLEWGDGGDMYDYIMKHDGGLDEAVARRYFSQIVRAIDYCHRLHVVHRDLKPENVVFFETTSTGGVEGGGGVVKLTDFGFSNKFIPGRKLETSCGSLAYSAPEILLGDSYDPPAVDIWSLGVILFMLVCGQPPFQEANDSETLTMIMDCRYQIPPRVSPECRDIISRMLVREPSDRASLSDILSHPWMMQGMSLVASPTVLMPLVCRESLSEEDHCYIMQRIVDGKIATREDILGSLESSAYDHITATYYLLAERLLRKRADANHETDSSSAGSEPSSGKVQPVLSPLALSPRVSIPSPSADDTTNASLMSPTSPLPATPTSPNPSTTSAPLTALHSEISLLMCRCAMIHEDSLEAYDNSADDDGAEVTTIDETHSDSEIADNIGSSETFDGDRLSVICAHGGFLDVPSLHGIPGCSLASVRSSPQLLNEICEETESVDDDDEPVNVATVQTSIPRRHSTEAQRHFDRLHRVHRRKLTTIIPRVASCSSSDTSDTDEVDQRKHRKNKSAHASPAACINILGRRDSSEHSSDNDNQPCSGPGGGDGSSGLTMGSRSDHSTQRGRTRDCGDRRSNSTGHMDSLHENLMETGSVDGYYEDLPHVLVGTDVGEHNGFSSQRCSDYDISNRSLYGDSSMIQDWEMNTRNHVRSVMRFSYGDFGHLVEKFGSGNASGSSGMMRWKNVGRYRSRSKFDPHHDTNIMAAALLAKIRCADALGCQLRTRKVSL